VAETTRYFVLFVHRDADARVCEERRRRQSTQPSADNAHRRRAAAVKKRWSRPTSLRTTVEQGGLPATRYPPTRKCSDGQPFKRSGL
jgi:hypothetical protein